MPASLPAGIVPLTPSEFSEGVVLRMSQFGNGYIQRSPESVNADTRTLNLEFFIFGDSECDNFATFLKARAADPLQFQAPGRPSSELYLAKMPFRRTYLSQGQNGQSAWKVSCQFDLVPGGAIASNVSLPATPTGLTAIATSQTSITIRWDSQTPNPSVWNIAYKAGSGSESVASAAYNSAYHSTGYTLNGLTPGTLYSIRVRAVNAQSIAGFYSSTIFVSTVAIPTPSPSPSPTPTPSPSPTPFMAAVTRSDITFGDGDLSLAGILVKSHNLGKIPSSVRILDAYGEPVTPDKEASLTNDTVSIDLAKFQPISGQWTLIITA